MDAERRRTAKLPFGRPDRNGIETSDLAVAGFVAILLQKGAKKRVPATFLRDQYNRRNALISNVIYQYVAPHHAAKMPTVNRRVVGSNPT